MRHSPVAGAPPTAPSSKPTPQARKPLYKLSPDNTPTMLKPSTPNINNSAEPNARISGRANKIKPVSTSAPIKPPMSDAENAAPSARAA